MELEVTKSSTCTSLADDNSAMAMEPEAENEVSLPVKKAKGLGAILSKLPTLEVSTEVSMAEKFKREVGSYLDQPSTDADSNPLLWWRSNSSIFPLLSSLVRKYLSVSGTSVPSEWIFSKGGLIVDSFCSRLKPDHVNTLIFVKKHEVILFL